VEEDEEEDGGLSLRRFESGSAKPPQMIADDSSSDEEENEPRSPPPMTNEELQMITGGEGSAELTEAYNDVAGCACHGHEAPKIEKVWEVPQKKGYTGGRIAIVQVSA